MTDTLVEHAETGIMECLRLQEDSELCWQGLLASCMSVSASVLFRMASPQMPKPVPSQTLQHSTESLRLLRQYEAFQGNHAICVAYRKAAWSLGCSPSLAKQPRSVNPILFLASRGFA